MTLPVDLPAALREELRAHSNAVQQSGAPHGVLVISRNPVAPWEDRQTVTPDMPCGLVDLARAAGADIDGGPWILNVNGRWIPRAEWQGVMIEGGTAAVLQRLPEGGRNGSRVLQIIIGIVLVIVGIFSSIYGGWPMIFQGVSMIVGGILSRTPKAPTPDQLSSAAQPSPTYNLQAQGNYARLGQAIPVQYGRCRFYPDFASQPYAEYAGNEQYLYQLFCLGHGDFDIEQLYIEDQPINGEVQDDGFYHSDEPFLDTVYQIVAPGQKVTLFPTRVLTSEAVAGQTLEGTSAWFQLTDADLDRIAVDLVAPRGLYVARDDGGLDAVTILVRVEVQKLEQSGAAWVPGTNPVLEKTTYSVAAADATPQRRSIDFPVDVGRWQVRIVRIYPPTTDVRTADELAWAGLRGYVPGDQDYGNVTMLAMKLRASDQISSQASRRINLIATRKVPTYDGSAWTTPQPSRSIAWALVDMLSDGEYGRGLADDVLPIAEVLALESAVWQSGNPDGQAFDYRFDRAVTAWEAATLIARAGRCTVFQQGGRIRVVRDEQRSLPTRFFMPRNISRGSLSLAYLMPRTEQADSVDVTYWDEITWRPETVRCTPPGITGTNPVGVDLAGVQRRQHAVEEGHFIARSNRYRRITGSFRTEMEGFLLSPGDPIAITHPMPAWGGGSGDLLAFTGTGKDAGDVLTLDEPVEFGVGFHYVGLSTAKGGFSGPWRVSVTPDPRQVVLAEDIDDDAYAPYVGGNRERTRWAFGEGEDFFAKAIVVPPIRPQGKEVLVNFVLDDPRAYDETGAVAPDRDQPYNLPQATAPVVRGVAVQFWGDLSAPSLAVSWEPAPTAKFYIVDLSHDGQTWTRAAEVTSTSVRVAVWSGVVWLRVAAIGSLRGPFVTWSGDVSLMPTIPADPTGLALEHSVPAHPLEWDGRDAIFVVDPIARAQVYRWEVWAGMPLALKGEYTTNEPRLTYSLERNRADGGPRRQVQIRVYGVNGSGWSEHPAAITVSNPQLPPPSLVGYDAGEALTVVATGADATDYAGTRFVMSQDPDFDPATAVPVADGPGVLYASGKLAAGNWYIYAAQYDTFGDDGLSWSGKITVHVSAVAAGIPKVADASTITAAPGSDPPGGDAYWAVWSLAHESLWSWDKPAGHYIDNSDLGNAYYNLITATRAAFGFLSAISGNLGNVTIGGAGWLRTEGATSFLGGGTGIFLGADSGQYKARFGGPKGSGVPGAGWDGSAFEIWAADGSTILKSGTALSISPLIDNSALVPSISAAAQSAVWANVTGTGRPQDGATVGATIGANLFGQMNASNISTYIANAAISNALIGSLGVDKLLAGYLAVGQWIGSANGQWFIRADGGASFTNVLVRGDVQATSLNAATGTFSGVLTADAVNAISTINIRGEAVTVMRSARQSGSVDATLGTWITLAAAGINVGANGRIAMMCDAMVTRYADSGGDGGFSSLQSDVEYRVLRQDGTTYAGLSVSDEGPLNAYITYYLQCRRVNGDPAIHTIVSNGIIVLLGAMR